VAYSQQLLETKQKQTIAAQSPDPFKAIWREGDRGGTVKPTAIRETSAASRNRATGEEESRRKLKGLAFLRLHTTTI
jgi:hypothetical protein